MKKIFKASLVLGIFTFLVAIVSLFFFKSDEKNPAIAIKTVENSIANHDKKNFYKFVDIESILNSSYDEVMEGLTDSDKSMSLEARGAVKNFTQMLKSPLLLSLRTAIDGYVATGKFNDSENLGVKDILSKTGIDQIEYRGLENISYVSDNEKEAVADIKIFQPELGQDFILKVILKVNENGDWQIVNVQNFHDFVMKIEENRHIQLEKYLKRTEEINSVHDKVIRDAEQKYSSVLSAGSLGQDNTRADLKDIMLNVLKKDWELRKQELFELNVPKGAETLQNLRIKICDLEISYAEEYAEWLSNKKVATIKSAEEKHRQAQILMTEANVLARRMAN